MRVETKKANKDYPEHGIAKGDTYYQWCFYRQRPTKSKTYPTRSQLTQNETLQTVYAAYDGELPTTADGVEEMAGDVREAGESAQEKFDNMPEGLQQGDTGQRLEAWAEACESAAGELDEIASDLREEEGRELPEKPDQDKDESEEDYEYRLDTLAGDVDDHSYYELDRDEWTLELNEETLHEAIGGTEPDLS